VQMKATKFNQFLFHIIIHKYCNNVSTLDFSSFSPVFIHGTICFVCFVHSTISKFSFLHRNGYLNKKSLSHSFRLYQGIFLSYRIQIRIYTRISGSRKYFVPVVDRFSIIKLSNDFSIFHLDFCLTIYG
jgi:hypothetical protein